MKVVPPSTGGIIVTGGGSGIGAAVCRQLAAADIAVGVLDRNASAAEEIAAEIGGVALCANVANSAELGHELERGAELLGGLVGLVNNAGIGNLKSFESYTDAEIDLIFAVNFSGTYSAMRSAAPLMRVSGGGSIVNVASVSGIRPTRGEAPYSAAKAAVIALSQAAALELAPQIRVNSVSPGFIRTPLNEVLAKDEELRSKIEAGTPLGRLGQAEEVAELIVFLLSDRASFVTGQNMVLDGGSLLNSAQMDSVLTTMLDLYS
ncbi:MAG: SDR family NAD(P)-dependent oxidoreductase [Microthrixaceae bacterium]